MRYGFGFETQQYYTGNHPVALKYEFTEVLVESEDQRAVLGCQIQDVDVFNTGIALGYGEYGISRLPKQRNNLQWYVFIGDDGGLQIINTVSCFITDEAYSRQAEMSALDIWG